MTEPVRVLVLLANPVDTDRLALDTEVRVIAERLSSADLSAKFRLDPRASVKATELSDYLLKLRPHILHFSGHGSPSGDLVVESDVGEATPLRIEALADLLGIAGGDLRYVVLNACYSAARADLLIQHVDGVVGTSRAISDAGALSFAAGFYRGLGSGLDVPTAFKLGCNEIDLVNVPEKDAPQLLMSENEGADRTLHERPESDAFTTITTTATAAARVELADQPGSGAGLAKRLVDLHAAMRYCHAAYLAFQDDRSWDAGKRWQQAIAALGSAMSPLAETLAIWDADVLSNVHSYHGVEAVSAENVLAIAIDTPFPRMYEDEQSDIGADFSLAIDSLGDFIKNNFTMEQIFGATE